MPRLRSDIWRELRIKAALTDDTDWAGTSQPAAGDMVAVSGTTKPVEAVYLFLVPLDVSDDPVAPETGTCTVTGIKIADIDGDDTVDATDLVVRSEAVALVPYYTEVRVQLGGALRWTVRLSSFANNPTGATQVRVLYREATV